MAPGGAPAPALEGAIPNTTVSNGFSGEAPGRAGALFTLGWRSLDF
jgi:hypothetical protein